MNLKFGIKKPALPVFKKIAEGAGFEPAVGSFTYNGFQDHPNRPLWHPSRIKAEHRGQC